MSGDPFPKAKQLSRGTKRYRRKVASPKQWAAITAAKIGMCRACLCQGTQLHHVVPRDFHGDDVPENIVPLCLDCHTYVHDGDASTCARLCASLTDGEYAYAIQKGGENIFERCYGVTYGR